ncbi:MAG: hypothetical protein OHK93_004410 [Ramalina farinacea]|uniref:Uncharacterized protein n=1 Tax=Ramalina farinacea TaxID=258253 RepID=A0AA43QU24_9LECA|nr:hypothetical protein [Ramalina farinacea]
MKDYKIMSSLSTKLFTLLPPSVEKTYLDTLSLLPILQINAELSTFLAIGMFLQTITLTLFPKYLAAAPAVLFLIYKLIYATPKSTQENPFEENVRHGKWSASIPNEDGTLPEKHAANGVVCFVVGSQFNHPAGIFAPGVKQLGDYFNSMWDDAEADPEHWGYLSRTPSLYSSSSAPSPDRRGNYLVTLSYWKSLDHLRLFATHSIHADGRAWWEKTRSHWPHLGIFHETYVIPPGHYETIYENFVPFGMGTVGLRRGKGEKMVGVVGGRRFL